MKGFFGGFSLSEDLRKMNFEAMNCVLCHICTKNRTIGQKTTYEKSTMKVISLMCILTLFRFWLAKGRINFPTFFEPLSFLILLVFLPCFPWFPKKTFFAGLFKKTRVLVLKKKSAMS